MLFAVPLKLFPALFLIIILAEEPRYSNDHVSVNLSWWKVDLDQLSNGYVTPRKEFECRLNLLHVCLNLTPGLELIIKDVV
jgi:hypothetical protein